VQREGAEAAGRVEAHQKAAQAGKKAGAPMEARGTQYLYLWAKRVARVRMDMAEENLTLSPLASCSRGGARVVGQGFRYMGRGE